MGAGPSTGLVPIEQQGSNAAVELLDTAKITGTDANGDGSLSKVRGGRWCGG